MLKWQNFQEVLKLAWLLVDQEIQNKYYKIYNNAIIMLFLMRIFIPKTVLMKSNLIIYRVWQITQIKLHSH